MAVTAVTALWSAGSSATGFLQKNAKWIGLAVIVLTLWWLFRPYFRVLFGLVPEDAKMQAGGGDVTADFYSQRKNVAGRLHETLTGNALTSSGRCQALYDALQLNDNQLRVIHNAYKNAHGDTLHSAIGATYTDDCSYLGMSDGLNTTLLEKLNTLGLT